MNAINLDLDEQFSFNFKRKVTIGGKAYNVTFNDQVGEVLQKLQLQIDSLSRSIESKAAGFDKMNVDQQQAFLVDKQNELITQIEQALDHLLGSKGAGKQIYEYYDCQSYALFQVIKALRETKEQLDGTNELQKQQEHAARRRQYLKPKVNKNAHSHR